MRKVGMLTVKFCYHRAWPEGHWFARDTMRFFGSRLPAYAYEGGGGCFFVTSEENFDRTTRLYSVRVQTPDGNIKTVGGFQIYRDRRSATNLARRLADCRLI